MSSGNEIYSFPREQQLVVYDRNNWQVILHDKEESKMVLFNSVDKSLMICHSSETLNNHNSHSRSSLMPSSPTNNKICPLCKQSVTTQESAPSFPQPHSPPREESSYMVRDYFHLINYQFEQEKARDSMPRQQPPPQSDSLPTDSLNSGYYRRFFVEEQKIGSGGYGSVFLCRHMINGIDLGKYAIKKIPVGDNRPWLMRVLREVKALETLKKHPNIINYQHSWLEADKTADFGPEIPCLFILMEYANGGSLADIMFGNKKKYLSEREIWKYFLDICQGLAFLHACGVIHRDIKPHNILLSNVINKEGKTETRLLISDFGTCAMKVRDPTLKRTGATGTIEYVAPELLAKDQYGNWNEAFDEKCDVWSLGVILYEMAFQKLPFPSASYVSARDYENLSNEILGFGGAPIPVTHSRSPELVQMIQILMKLNPQDRPLVSEILSSPIIAKLSKQQEAAKGSSSRAPGTGQLRSSSNSCKIVRLPSIENNLDKLENTHQVMPITPLRRRSISSGRLPPAHDISTHQPKLPPLIPTFLSKYVNRFSKVAFVSLLLLKLWFCLNTCTIISAPSPAFLYPVVITSVTQLLLSDARGSRFKQYQYALAGLEWLWGALLFLMGGICINPDSDDNFVIQHAALTLLTMTTVYLTNK